MQKQGLLDEQIRSIYNKLQDEVSKTIFRYRLSYFLDQDPVHLLQMVGELNKHKPKTALGTYSDLVESKHLLHNGIVIYGAGTDSEACIKSLTQSGIVAECFCDRDKEKQKRPHLGLPVISPKELASKKNAVILIATAAYAQEVYTLLCDMGFSHHQIFQFTSNPVVVMATSAFDTYFDATLIGGPQDEEIYVDAGCYDGGTIKDFVDYSGGKYRKIYGFEPFPDSYKNTIENISKWGIDRAEILSKGAWNTRSKQYFRIGESLSGSGITQSKSLPRNSHGVDVIQIETETIDAVVKDDKVTLIKMDIEGSELEALEGARNTIIKNKPRLAICVYHKPQDILTITQYISNLVPEYRLFLRHHPQFDPYKKLYSHFLDTVLYASI